MAAASALGQSQNTNISIKINTLFFSLAWDIMRAFPARVYSSGHPSSPDTFYLTGIQLKIFSLINQKVIFLFPF
jgi:hypothetical protein